MSAAWQAVARRVVPLSIRRTLRLWFGWRWFVGNYRTWADARAAADDSAGSATLERVIAAARSVRITPGAWDRDGVVFRQPAFHAPLVDAMQRIAGEEKRMLCVIEFGGGLGSTWWQHRAAFDRADIDWRVVEVPALVEVGRREFSAPPLSFHATLEDAFLDRRPNVVLFSSVLQYVEAPHSLLQAVAGRAVRHVILDRVGFTNRGRDRIALQHTPPSLGGGASACWLFDYQTLVAAVGPGYECAAEWRVDFDAVDGQAEYRGVWLRRIAPTDKPARIG
jgi:putative methyltransferase (TIGR04325 family)